MDRKLRIFLDGEGVKYELLRHAPTYTALETAQATHVQGKELAKSVMVRIDGVMCMVVVPATHWVDLDKLQILTGADMVNLVNEREFESRFPDCEPGAMPPFGNLYGVPLYCADALREDEEIVFNAGTHTEAVKMKYADFERLARPTVGWISSARPLVEQ